MQGKWLPMLIRRATVVAVGTLLLTGHAATGCRGQNAAPSPAQGSKPRHTNHLINETSPYLLQHAHNPVDWYPWGTEAFEKARKEGKPIFLSVGYSACHWCHVMERESFENEEVARILNEHFVAIKVDREQRPDVDEIYMTAVLLQTKQGGWPMSVFLAPDAKPFLGGTYYPRDVFVALLNKVRDVWKDPSGRKKIDEEANRLAKAIGEFGAPPLKSGEISPALFGPAVRQILDNLDGENGGFTPAPKFPPATLLALLLAENRKKPDARTLHAVKLTLDHMARGGLYDQVGGGFHRYSTDKKWLVPHFEKMLYDNAQLAWIYLLAYQETSNPYYRRIATETLDFLLREMRDPKGGFWSSLDADSAQGEGQYYLWTPGEVTAILGASDGPLFNRIYGISEAGNFEKRNIPNLIAKSVEEWAKELKTTPEALWSRLDAMRAKLRAERAKRTRPGLDDKVMTSWNGLAIRALALGFDVTGETRYRQAAEKAADFLLTALRKEGKLLHTYRNGKTQAQSFLEDYSNLAVGLLDLHHATGEARRLTEAQALTGTLWTDFWDEKSGTLFSTSHQHETLLARFRTAEDGATPSGQSMAAVALTQLARATGEPLLRSRATQLLNTYTTPMQRYAGGMANMLLAAHGYFTPTRQVPQRTDGTAPVQVRLTGVPAQTPPGEAFEVEVRFTILSGWHVNAEKPADPMLTPTKVGLAAGPFEVVTVTYPEAQTVTLGVSSKPMPVYTGEAIVRLRLKARSGADVGALRLRVTYQACNDQVCALPVEVLLTPGTGNTPPGR